MRKTFKSLGEAYNFYNQYAYERGFSVRKDSLKYSHGPEGTKRLRKYMLGNVAEIQNFLRITKINLWSNLATRGRGVHLHTIVDRDAEALQERG